MKKCKKCLIEKAHKFFYKRKSKKDGYRDWCKICEKDNNIRYRKTKKGLAIKIYAKQKTSSKVRGHKMPDYSSVELYEWMIKQDNFKSLYKNWEKTNFIKDNIPSVDRIDDYKPYTLDNIKLTTWKNNNKRSHDDRINGLNNKQSKTVYQYNLEGKFIKEWYSTQSVQRILGVKQGNVSSVALGKRNHAGGFIWSYKKLHG